MRWPEVIGRMDTGMDDQLGQIDAWTPHGARPTR
jgi:hypothetical protein